MARSGGDANLKGTRLGPYRIDALIGERGMGQAYRGLDTRLDRIVLNWSVPAK